MQRLPGSAELPPEPDNVEEPAAVAQLVEQRAFTPTRVGSSPTGGIEAGGRRLLSCKRHGVILHYRFKRGTGFTYRCKRCVGEAVTRRHRRLKALLVEEHGGCCRVCAFDDSIYALQFHHVDPAEKAFAMTMGRGKSLAAYREEGLKCALVCANCHARIEAGEIPSPPALRDLAPRPCGRRPS